jgi:hypothetical protein
MYVKNYKKRKKNNDKLGREEKRGGDCVVSKYRR